MREADLLAAVVLLARCEPTTGAHLLSDFSLVGGTVARVGGTVARVRSLLAGIGSLLAGVSDLVACGRPSGSLARTLGHRYLAEVRSLLPLIGSELSSVGGAGSRLEADVAFVGSPVAFVSNPIAFVSNPVAFIRNPVACIRFAVCVPVVVHRPDKHHAMAAETAHGHGAAPGRVGPSRLRHVCQRGITALRWRCTIWVERKGDVAMEPLPVLASAE